MPTVIEQEEVIPSWTDLDIHPARDTQSRAPGEHVSGLIKRVALAKRLYTPEDAEDDMPLIILNGLGWEWACARLYPEMTWQPGELELDGVSGNPDGVCRLALMDRPTDQRIINVVDEFKYTRKSLRVKGGKPDEYKDITKEWLWMAQVKSYLHMLNNQKPKPDRPWLHGRMHVCWSMGEYKWPYTARYFRYLIEFRPKELTDNWAYLRTA